MNLTETEPTKRFSNRVENYVKYRPSYPVVILALLRQEVGLTPESVVADVGSGTGNLARLFLGHGNLVYGVEPNDEMRAAGELLLAGYPNFRTVAATAEATTLDDESVDLVVAGQAFHWFDREAARVEFSRILRPGGWVVLAWNQWRPEGSPFLRDYDALLKQYGLDVARVRHSTVSNEEVLAHFFAPGGYRTAVFDNQQVFDFAGLKGRLLSSSYTPLPGHPNYEPMIAGLAQIFEQRQLSGQVTFLYDTWVYYGQL
ncbi:MAG: class I SAM-dependent methyltransferase [Chloroflexi bacterium]|nr:class I SAM-dependent methyltransferase [Chloroflexota bacterium]MCI0575589.1 class I SAM-dependent methyltransferase [Chloroflexota bacterium]MCI0645074.1 class I SAM-dependent methyltransferase [Chloroflexota bacterium]MCI0731910.1 class I SAM-dependent methyltransferase [Chloroflexota bacterium]